MICAVQDSENGSDSGYPSERRSEGDPNDHVDGVNTFVCTKAIFVKSVFGKCGLIRC